MKRESRVELIITHDDNMTWLQIQDLLVKSLLEVKEFEKIEILNVEKWRTIS